MNTRWCLALGALGVLALAADRSRLRAELTAVSRRATRDPLTELPNRAGLALAWSRLAGRVSGVVVLDLDGFKPVNDTHGHEAGDVVLRTVAARLAAHTPGGVARLGGDEFALLLTGDPYPAARLLAEQVARPVSLPGGPAVSVSASVGLVLAPGWDLRAALAEADAAMYRAKSLRRPGGAVAVFDSRRDDRPDPADRPGVRTRDLGHQGADGFRAVAA